MSDQGSTGSPGSGDHDSRLWVILGIALIAAGVFFGARNLGIVPWPLQSAWNVAVKARFGIGIVVLGVVLIVWAQSGRTLTVPRKGTKLYRKREEKWIAGVLGGLAEYLGVDATLLRLAFLALVLVFDVGGLVVAYIIMAILVPLEPQAVAVTTAPAPPPDGDATGNA